MKEPTQKHTRARSRSKTSRSRIATTTHQQQRARISTRRRTTNKKQHSSLINGSLASLPSGEQVAVHLVGVRHYTEMTAAEKAKQRKAAQKQELQGTFKLDRDYSNIQLDRYGAERMPKRTKPVLGQLKSRMDPVGDAKRVKIPLSELLDRITVETPDHTIRPTVVIPMHARDYRLSNRKNITRNRIGDEQYQQEQEERNKLKYSHVAGSVNLSNIFSTPNNNNNNNNTDESSTQQQQQEQQSTDSNGKPITNPTRAQIADALLQEHILKRPVVTRFTPPQLREYRPFGIMLKVPPSHQKVLREHKEQMALRGPLIRKQYIAPDTWTTHPYHHNYNLLTHLQRELLKDIADNTTNGESDGNGDDKESTAAATTTTTTEDNNNLSPQEKQKRKQKQKHHPAIATLQQLIKNTWDATGHHRNEIGNTQGFSKNIHNRQPTQINNQTGELILLDEDTTHGTSIFHSASHIQAARNLREQRQFNPYFAEFKKRQEALAEAEAAAAAQQQQLTTQDGQDHSTTDPHHKKRHGQHNAHGPSITQTISPHYLEFQAKKMYEIEEKTVSGQFKHTIQAEKRRFQVVKQLFIDFFTSIKENLPKYDLRVEANRKRIKDDFILYRKMHLRLRDKQHPEMGGISRWWFGAVGIAAFVSWVYYKHSVQFTENEEIETFWRERLIERNVISPEILKRVDHERYSTLQAESDIYYAQGGDTTGIKQLLNDKAKQTAAATANENDFDIKTHLKTLDLPVVPTVLYNEVKPHVEVLPISNPDPTAPLFPTRVEVDVDKINQLYTHKNDPSNQLIPALHHSANTHTDNTSFNHNNNINADNDEEETVDQLIAKIMQQQAEYEAELKQQQLNNYDVHRSSTSLLQKKEFGKTITVGAKDVIKQVFEGDVDVDINTNNVGNIVEQQQQQHNKLDNNNINDDVEDIDNNDDVDTTHNKNKKKLKKTMLADDDDDDEFDVTEDYEDDDDDDYENDNNTVPQDNNNNIHYITEAQEYDETNVDDDLYYAQHDTQYDQIYKNRYAMQRQDDFDLSFDAPPTRHSLFRQHPLLYPNSMHTTPPQSALSTFGVDTATTAVINANIGELTNFDNNNNNNTNNTKYTTSDSSSSYLSTIGNVTWAAATSAGGAMALGTALTLLTPLSIPAQLGLIGGTLGVSSTILPYATDWLEYFNIIGPQNIQINNNNNDHTYNSNTTTHQTTKIDSTTATTTNDTDNTKNMTKTVKKTTKKVIEKNLDNDSSSSASHNKLEIDTNKTTTTTTATPADTDPIAEFERMMQQRRAKDDIGLMHNIAKISNNSIQSTTDATTSSSSSSSSLNPTQRQSQTTQPQIFPLNEEPYTTNHKAPVTTDMTEKKLTHRSKLQASLDRVKQLQEELLAEETEADRQQREAHAEYLRQRDAGLTAGALPYEQTIETSNDELWLKKAKTMEKDIINTETNIINKKQQTLNTTTTSNAPTSTPQGEDSFYSNLGIQTTTNNNLSTEQQQQQQQQQQKPKSLLEFVRSVDFNAISEQQKQQQQQSQPTTQKSLPQANDDTDVDFDAIFSSVRNNKQYNPNLFDDGDDNNSTPYNSITGRNNSVGNPSSSRLRPKGKHLFALENTDDVKF